MDLQYGDFVHHDHLPIFAAAAREFDCHILVRKTGRASLGWIGKRGFTGKRADMKAKTADVAEHRHPVAGLVCSPELRPGAFSAERIDAARKEWAKSSHLVTVPKDKLGFDDSRAPRGCLTPYLLQNNPEHEFYGCVALVDMGLLKPRYVHGDYDLYAIIPDRQGFPANTPVYHQTIGSTMAPARLGSQARAKLKVPNLEGPLSFRVATYIDVHISMTSPDLLGALMVNHGEQVNLGAEGHTFEPVLAIMPRRANGEWARVLATREDHEAFYRANALGREHA
ncbi:MAG TPA: hypothetical protein VFH71_05310 [Rhodanobacteraceae bacterium]|nr:hypothetical protein [Rhodanobacteraceae bacterium]